MGWGWTARTALLKKCHDLRALLSDAEVELLRSLLPPSKENLELYLRDLRDHGFEFADASPARRRKLLQNLEPRQRATLCFCGLAWATRTLVMFEILERSALGPNDLQKFAGAAALRIVSDFEDEDAWLWPLPGVPPWYEEVVVTVE